MRRRQVTREVPAGLAAQAATARREATRTLIVGAGGAVATAAVPAVADAGVTPDAEPFVPTAEEMVLMCWRSAAGAAGAHAPTESARKPPRRAATPHQPELQLAPRRGPMAAQIAALVGHEIRGPLSTALLYLSILEHQLGGNASSQPAVRCALDVAREEIRRVERLVVRVIELQRKGRVAIQPRVVEAGRIVTQAVKRTLVGAEPSHAPVEVLTRPGIVGWWDESVIEQIVHNLLTNALKFGAGRPVRVRVGYTPAGIRLAVQDRGAGIDPSWQTKIFWPYVRNPSNRLGGLGLGLWLVRALTESHGGQVTVRSRPGRGTTFTVTIPERPPVDFGGGGELWTDGDLARAAATPSATEATPMPTPPPDLTTAARKPVRLAEQRPSLTR